MTTFLDAKAGEDGFFGMKLSKDFDKPLDIWVDALRMVATEGCISVYLIASQSEGQLASKKEDKSIDWNVKLDSSKPVKFTVKNEGEGVSDVEKALYKALCYHVSAGTAPESECFGKLSLSTKHSPGAIIDEVVVVGKKEYPVEAEDLRMMVKVIANLEVSEKSLIDPAKVKAIAAGKKGFYGSGGQKESERLSDREKFFLAVVRASSIEDAALALSQAQAAPDLPDSPLMLARLDVAKLILG